MKGERTMKTLYARTPRHPRESIQIDCEGERAVTNRAKKNISKRKKFTVPDFVLCYK